MDEARSNSGSRPLSFQLIRATHGSGCTPPQSWSHELYRGPEDKAVQILYSRTIEDSERLAQKFLAEPVVGFDMEWTPYIRNDADARLQDRIGLIQLASEDKIGLFHIGLHAGTEPEQLIAPSLRKLIESSDIVKTGVNIISADFSRLSKWFNLEPRAAFELSHLHNLITYADTEPSKCTTKIVSLANHVEAHFGLQLPKGEERMSRWTVPLSYKQRHYAAADAYAGFMLYHCMNAKRLAMTPQPPLPIHGDKYDRMRRGTLILLQPANLGGEAMTVPEFLQPPADSRNTSEDTTAREGQTRETMTGTPRTPGNKHRQSQGQTPRTPKATPKYDAAGPFDLLDTIFSNQVFEKLRLHRRTVARQRQCSAFIVAHDSVLREIARKCPVTETDLRQIKGIGSGKFADYGQAWLNIVNNAVTRLQQVDLPGPPWKNVAPFDASLGPREAVQPARRLPEVRSMSDSSATRPPPTLHTGLSFSIANAKLSDDTLDQVLAAPRSPSDSGSAFENDERSPSPSTRKRKLEQNLRQANSGASRKGLKYLT